MRASAGRLLTLWRDKLRASDDASERTFV